MSRVIGNWTGSEVALTLNCSPALEMTGKALRIDDAGILIAHPDGPLFIPVGAILQVRGFVPIPEWSDERAIRPA